MSVIKEFGVGFSFIRKGFAFFKDHKGLWWYAIIPTTINILVLIAMTFIMIHYFDELTGWIFGPGRGLADMGLLAKAWHYIAAVLIYIAKAIIFISLLIFLLIAAFVFSMILAGPFNDALSEKVEKLAAGAEEIPFSWKQFIRSAWRSIIVESIKALFFLLIPLLLLLLNLIPAIGSAIYLILTSLFAAFDIGFNFFDIPMARRLMVFRERISIGWRNRYYLIGFGIIALIPLFAYFFAAPMVVGGTLLFEHIVSSPLEGGGLRRGRY